MIRKSGLSVLRPVARQTYELRCLRHYLAVTTTGVPTPTR